MPGFLGHEFNFKSAHQKCYNIEVKLQELFKNNERYVLLQIITKRKCYKSLHKSFWIPERGFNYLIGEYMQLSKNIVKVLTVLPIRPL